MQKNYYLCKLLASTTYACTQHHGIPQRGIRGVLPTWSAKLQKNIEI